MALTHCPECNREVSETAATCPYCGYTFGGARTTEPRERVVVKKKRLAISNVVIGLLAVLLILLAVAWWLGIVRFT